MHYEVHDSSGTPLLLLHGGLFDIHQQFGELLPTKLLGLDNISLTINQPASCLRSKFGRHQWDGRNTRR